MTAEWMEPWLEEEARQQSAAFEKRRRLRAIRVRGQARRAQQDLKSGAQLPHYRPAFDKPEIHLAITRRVLARQHAIKKGHRVQPLEADLQIL